MHCYKIVFSFNRSRDEHNVRVNKRIADEIALSEENGHSSLLIDSKYNERKIWCL